MTTAMQTPLSAVEERAATRKASYRSLVVDIAAGKEVAPDQVETILSGAGKSVDDLNADVEAVQERMELRRQFEESAAACERIGVLRKRIDALQSTATEQIDKINTKLRETVQPLAVEFEECREMSLRLAASQGQLFHGCPDQSLVSRYRNVCSAIHSLDADQESARDRLHNAEGGLDQARQRGDVEAVELYTGRISAANTAIKILVQQKAQQVEARDSVFREMLVCL